MTRYLVTCETNGCCGGMEIFEFGNEVDRSALLKELDKEYRQSVKDLGASETKRIYGTKQEYTKNVLEEEYACPSPAEIDADLKEIFSGTGNSSAFFVASLIDAQRPVVEPVLLKHGFRAGGRAKNLNSGNMVTVYTKVFTRRPKRVPAKTYW